jgi:predicted GNAT family acetyltransferase
MVLTDGTILNAIEDSLMVCPHTPGTLEHLDVAGIQGRFSPLVSHPLLNLVTKTLLTFENADTTIQTLLDQFIEMNVSLGWMVSDSTTPSDLTERLEKAGFAKAEEFAGMSLGISTHSIIANPAVRVRKAEKSDGKFISGLYQRGYPIPKAFADVIVKIAELAGGDNYLAYVEDAEEPVAVASMQFLREQPIVLLGGAATLPEYRGRGIYTSLVAKRLDDARDKGMQAAVMQADRSSSAPITKKLGFVERCSMELYAWMPPGD